MTMALHGSSLILRDTIESLSREDALFMAKNAEKAERYPDMVTYMKRVMDLCDSGDDLATANGVERNCLSVSHSGVLV